MTLLIRQTIAPIYNCSGDLTDRLLSGPDANQALADENGSGTVSWILSDNQGTIRDVAQYNSGTNTTSVVDHLKYGSFGNISTCPDARPSPSRTNRPLSLTSPCTAGP